jgi:hypothetical protein
MAQYNRTGEESSPHLPSLGYAKRENKVWLPDGTIKAKEKKR